MAEFSLDLNEDQQQIQKWVHDFSETVIRPAGHEWDEREETPWPIIEEAARIGLYSFDFITQCFLDESGLLMPIANEELQNDYWLRRFQAVQMWGQEPAMIAHRLDRIGAITPAVVQEAFKKYFPADRTTVVTLVPAPAAK